MTVHPLLLSTGGIAAICIVVVVCVVIWFLLRNRVRCPKDGSGMALVSPEKGHHMVFRCTQCGHEKKTKIPKGRR